MHKKAKKKTVEKAATKIADNLIGYMEEAMTPAQARAMREDLHKLAVKSNRRAVRFATRM